MYGYHVPEEFTEPIAHAMCWDAMNRSRSAARGLGRPNAQQLLLHLAPPGVGELFLHVQILRHEVVEGSIERNDRRIFAVPQGKDRL